MDAKNKKTGRVNRNSFVYNFLFADLKVVIGLNGLNHV